MKSIWWLLIIAMGMVFYFLGSQNMQIAHFMLFIVLFLIIIGISLIIFWFFQRGKTKHGG
ncbi:MAG: hypothetical protein ABII06_20495 [Pseudomonadota bacterium]